MEREHTYFVYILASGYYGTLYTGVTNDVVGRTQQHKDGVSPGFTKRYGVSRLVYFETHGDVTVAIKREKQIKRWRRAWKISLIERENPQWIDLQAHMLSLYRHQVRVLNERGQSSNTVIAR